MLKKSLRLSTEQINEVMEKGTVVHSPLFTIRYIKRDTGATKFAAVAPKGVAKTAVSRNRERRRVYAAIAGIKKGVKPGFLVAIISKNKAIGAEFSVLQIELNENLIKAKII